MAELRTYFVPWEFVNTLEGISYRYARVRAFTLWHARRTVTRHHQLKVRVIEHKIVEVA